MKQMINFVTDKVKYIDELGTDLNEEIDIGTLISRNPEMREKFRYEGKISGRYEKTRRAVKKINSNQSFEESFRENTYSLVNNTNNSKIDYHYVFGKNRDSIKEKIYIQNMTEGHICVGYGKGEDNKGNRYIIRGFASVHDVPMEIWDSYFFQELFHRSKARFISEKDFRILRDAYDKKEKMLEHEREDRKDRKGLDNTVQHSEGSSHRSSEDFVTNSISEEIDLGSQEVGSGIGLNDVLSAEKSSETMSDEEISSFINGKF